MKGKSFFDLMREAPGTVTYFMESAIEEIDSVFGDGYAQNHPVLLAAFLDGSVREFTTGAIIKAFGEKLGDLNSSITSISLG
jgi:hypothetical protein